MTDTAAIIAALLALALIGTLTARDGPGRILTYGGSFLLPAGLPIKGFQALTAPTQHLQLPLGLPWIATNLRLDALSGFFLVLIGLGGAGASLFALGYGRHEAHPERVLPFYPAFLAGMALVTIAGPYGSSRCSCSRIHWTRIGVPGSARASRAASAAASSAPLWP